MEQQVAEQNGKLCAYGHIRIAVAQRLARLEADFSWKPATIKALHGRLKTKEGAMEKNRG